MVFIAIFKCLKPKNLVNRKTYKAFLVGVAGFEPAASTSQTWRDNRATLHPENMVSRFRTANIEIFFRIQ